MVKDDMVYLRHMLDFALEAILMIHDKKRADFDVDRVLRNALVHVIQNLGEAARRVSKDGREKYSDIPWQEIIGMRSVIVHDYLHVDDEAVWRVVKRNIPDLVIKLTKIIPPEDLGE